MYVRETASGEIEFRLWMEKQPEVWERHPWISYDVITKANALYEQERDSKQKPLELYDLTLAKALLETDQTAN